MIRGMLLGIGWDHGIGGVAWGEACEIEMTGPSQVWNLQKKSMPINLGQEEFDLMTGMPVAQLLPIWLSRRNILTKAATGSGSCEKLRLTWTWNDNFRLFRKIKPFLTLNKSGFLPSKHVKLDHVQRLNKMFETTTCQNIWVNHHSPTSIKAPQKQHTHSEMTGLL